MKPARLPIVALLALVLVASAAAALADGRVALMVGSGTYAHIPPPAAGFGVTVARAAQDPSAVEAELGLDRPTRRLIQQGLPNEGFDAGTPRRSVRAAHTGGDPGLAGGTRACRDGISRRRASGGATSGGVTASSGGQRPGGWN